MKTYVDQHDLSSSFLGFRVSRLLDIIIEQGDDYLAQAGIVFPARINSTILLIDEYSEVSTNDIAGKLGHPHQLVAQRVELLLSLKLVTRVPDPYDNRRKVLKLTSKGKAQVKLLRRCLTDASSAFDRLFQELGVDLNQTLDNAYAAFLNQSLFERVHNLHTNQKKVAAARVGAGSDAR
ncbi:MarR family winged helix-turn-helix transcriptional regulator [Hyphococcus flavus]|uniref:MarR family winged helix-turn-helix transcriptional regulator n=1 Tax=Hyphococcus flavus TaxID=1866326 RepID=A0AAE9ZAT5_9PROT|nr:MarR family winged helix-turn-helix transcriptional regulator [Hyphococcus flavus]WDI30889.1 MarR family winged helix-turn-helix transcriptional regulator [Hyphococcus flavus]